MSKLTKTAWENKHLTGNTKCTSTRHAFSPRCTYMRREYRFKSFHLLCLRRILGVKWQEHITNSEILSRADISSMHFLLSQRRLRWLGHVHWMDDGRIPKEVLYGQLTAGVRKVGRPALCGHIITWLVVVCFEFYLVVFGFLIESTVFLC